MAVTTTKRTPRDGVMRELFRPRTFTVVLKGTTPLSWSKEIEKCPTKKDYTKHEEDHWRDKIHQLDGAVAIPTMAIRGALEHAAKGMTIPGKGKATYANVIKCSVKPLDPVVKTTAKVEDLYPEWLLVPSNPSNKQKGIGGRVRKCFPIVKPGWEVTASFLVVEEQLTEEVLSEALVRAGVTVGLGRWRPGVGGLNGCFEVVSIAWS